MGYDDGYIHSESFDANPFSIIGWGFGLVVAEIVAVLFLIGSTRSLDR